MSAIALATADPSAFRLPPLSAAARAGCLALRLGRSRDIGTLYAPQVPVSDDSPSPSTRASTTAEPAPAQQSVLLAIDDDTEFLTSIRRILIREGWVVLTASDPTEGLLSYQEHWQGISLVLLDYYMPGLRGDVVWERLHRINPQVRVLWTSASDDYIPHRMLNSGQSAFVQKPATRKELLRRIKEISNNHDQTGPAPAN